jgi:hypothetical protein
MPKFAYQLYGLIVATNRPLPGFISQPYLHHDVQVTLQGSNQDTSCSSQKATCGLDVILNPEGNDYCLWFQGDDRLSFYINAAGTRITAIWQSSVIAEVTSLLIGPTLGCVLRLQGRVCLHGCVIQIGEQAIAFIGDSGAGKSTLAAWFAQQGHAVLADDIVALTLGDGSWLVHPGYPRLRLWPDSAQAVCSEPSALDRVFGFCDKRYVPLSVNAADDATGGTFYNQPLPLAAIYVLSQRQPELASPTIQGLALPDALMSLLQHRSVSHLKLDKSRQHSELDQLAQVARDIPVKKLLRPDDLHSLAAVYQAVIRDLNSLSPE